MSRELTLRSIHDVVSEVLSISAPLVIVTGGEPALQREELVSLLDNLRQHGRRVEIETNGSVALGAALELADLVVASPKLNNSGMTVRQRQHPQVIQQLASAPNVVFKFVVTGAEELGEVAAIVAEFKIAPSKVWIMPEATEKDVLDRRLGLLAGPVAHRGWSLSTRLQVALWDGERGR